LSDGKNQNATFLRLESIAVIICFGMLGFFV